MEQENPLADKTVYLLGSLKNREKIIPLAKNLRKMGFKEVFEDWISPGPDADDYWRDYEKERGRDYLQALGGWAGTHVFEFDSFHIERSDIGIMCMPCGKSGHLELGNMLGSGKRGYILFDGEPERWDVMYQFADGIYFNQGELEKELVENSWKPTQREGFGNLFMWYQTVRNQGLSENEAKKYVRDRVDSMMENHRGYERKAFEFKYAAALELLK